MRSLCVVLAAGFVVAACANATVPPGTPAQTTGASRQPVHTVDNAGFVDNSGRTSDEYPMGELGGARPTEGGGRPPASSPSTVPLPAGGGNVESSFRPGTTPPPTGAATSPRTSEDDDNRLGRATCDREVACNRIGAGQAWKSADSCVVHFTAVSRGQIEKAGCPNGIKADQLALCLKAVRTLPCNAGPAKLETIPACHGAALCGQ
ncbi:MAG: hypothetical protein JWP97_788 [Labilithrix sp.]|nr:hypothetical protein [Labilithrix sp.]